MSDAATPPVLSVEDLRTYFFTQDGVTRAVDGVFDSIRGALSKGKEVRVVGFGTFHVTKRAASQGRNPRTGQAIQIAATKTPGFRAGKGLKDAIQ